MASLSTSDATQSDMVAALINQVNEITVNEDDPGKTKDGQNGLQEPSKPSETTTKE